MSGQGSMVMDGGTALRAGARRGGQASYDETFVGAYERYYTRVFAYIYSRVGNVELTKDLTAEVFEKAYVKGHDLREPAAYTTWLFTIAKNVVIGHYRRHKRETDGMDKLKESIWLTESPLDPERDVLRNEAASRLMKHLKRLSARDQDLMTLKFEGELSYAEISRALNLSEVNVRVSIFRALKRLRGLMREEEERSPADNRDA